MFPMKFAFDVIKEFSEPDDYVIDPFAGRASSVYAAAVQGRHGVGIEINPVGWLYGHVKLQPTTKGRLLSRLEQLEEVAASFSDNVEEMPEFFHWCFSKKVLQFLLAARQELNWRTSIIDGTLMVIILIDLHGRRETSLSNQMRQSKSMSPDYSIRWWKERDMQPPDVDPVAFLKNKITWRYTHGYHKYTESRVILGDSTQKIKRLRSDTIQPFKLLFTSPPYYDITNYHYDQWLRLWMLGGSDQPEFENKGDWQKKFASKSLYAELLITVFQDSQPLLDEDATIYVRTDMRKFTFETTLETLIQVFPQKHVCVVPRPVKKPTQTALYGDKSSKPGEADIILYSTRKFL